MNEVKPAAKKSKTKSLTPISEAELKKKVEQVGELAATPETAIKKKSAAKVATAKVQPAIPKKAAKPAPKNQPETASTPVSGKKVAEPAKKGKSPKLVSQKPAKK